MAYQSVHPARREQLVDEQGVEGVDERGNPVTPNPPAWNQTSTKNEPCESDNQE